METTLISVLVIDADSASRNYLSNILSKNGYSVLTATAGREGLISAWRDQPGIIILDPALPDLSGLPYLVRKEYLNQSYTWIGVDRQGLVFFRPILGAGS